MSEIEFLRESIIVLTAKFEALEKWCIKHEVEGMEYGNEFEARDENMMNDFSDLAERINIIADAVISLNKRIDDLPPIPGDYR